MTNKFYDKVLKYAEKLLAKEKDKYDSGMKHDYFSTEDSYNELADFIQTGNALKAENRKLRSEIKDLQDRLYGRG